MQRGDRRKANHTDQKQNASDLSLDEMAGGVYPVSYTHLGWPLA